MMQQHPPLPTAAMAGGTATHSALPSLTSTTAPGKTFASRSEMQRHYKSDWHRYNLKRREAGLPLLNEVDFTARLEAAMALRREREGREERSGVDHRKDKQQQKKKQKKKDGKQPGRAHKRKPAFATQRDERDEPFRAEERSAEDAMPDHSGEEGGGDASMAEEEEPPEINPSQSIFDNHVSPTPADNLSYLQSNFSFYLPDRKYCTDLEGFLGYCNEKVRIGNVCLYCQKSFTSTEAVLKHMRDKRHCKIRYERGVDQEEFDVFYDFEELNREILGEGAEAGKVGGDDAVMNDEDNEAWEDVDDEDEEWEDAPAEMDEDDDDELYDAYQSQVASRGFDITPLGELIFPDGRIVGHRGLARYYKQRFAPDRTRRAAVRHATEAAGDVLHEGRVVNVHRLREERQAAGSRKDLVPAGRQGGGILVADGDRGGFSALSLYRFRAVVKKQRRDNASGQRLEYRSRMNMNKMNKKGNNIATGVVTAMMPR